MIRPRRLALVAVCTASLTLSFASTTAKAQPTPEARLTAPDLFALAAEAQVNGRVEDALAIYDALTQDADADVRAEARFRKGMTFAGERRFTDAAVAFRQLLDEKPEAIAARLELARMLAAIGDDSGARRAIRQVQASGLPDDVAVTVDQFALALRSNRRLGGSLELALAPDSNINRATRSQTLSTIVAPLVLSRDARSRSEIGVRTGGQGYVRLPISPKLAFVPRVAANGLFYRSSQFNDVAASGLLGLEWLSGRDRFTPSVGSTKRWFGGEPFATTTAASLDWLHPIGRQAQVLVHAGGARVRYDVNDLQDGGLFDGAVTFERAVTARSGYGVTVTGVRQTARDPGYATTSGGVSTVTWRDAGSATLVATAGLSRLAGDERLFLFAEPRREWLLRSSLAATWRRLQVAGFAPGLRLVAERNWSSVQLFDYRRLAAELQITRAFQ